MIVYKDYATFSILGTEINLISEELYSGRNTVAEMNDAFHFVGNEYPTISTAIFLWQEINGRDLSSEELRQTMKDNNFLSEAV